VAVLPLPPAFIPPAINAAVTTVATASAANKVVPLVVTTVGLKATLPILLVGAAILGTIALVGELAQIWSLFNSKPEVPPEGTLGFGPLPGPARTRRTRIESAGPSFWFEIMGTSEDRLEVREVFVREAADGPRFQLRGDLYRKDGTTLLDRCLSNTFSGLCNDFTADGYELTVLIDDGEAQVEQEPDVVFTPEQPLPPPPVLEDLDLQLTPLPPLPLLIPNPSPAPTGDPSTDPQPVPEPQPDPQPAGPGPGLRPAPPATLPRTPGYPQPTPTQQPTPTGQETAPDGELVPLPLPLPTPTSPTDHVINGERVPANGPAPTLTGISQELGRLERKAAQMLDPGRAPTGPNIDRLGLLADLLGSLVEAVFFLQQGGEYEISSPCELTEAGDRVPVAVPFSGAFSSFGVLSNKVDALAGLLQAHKDLKQPICKQTPAIGEPVTVNFEQVN
jgi:hypothetical protein